MKFNASRVGYLVNSLKVLILWAVVYGVAIVVNLNLADMVSNFYIDPSIESLGGLSWLEWHGKIFWTVTLTSVLFNAVWVLFVLPFTADSEKMKHLQFNIGFIISVLFMLLFEILGLWIILGLEMRGLIFYGVFYFAYFPLTFVLNRLFVAGRYKKAYWFTGGENSRKEQQ